METITTQKQHDLDHDNRFFDDNLKVMHNYGDKKLPLSGASKRRLNKVGYAPKMYSKNTRNSAQKPKKQSDPTKPEEAIRESRLMQSLQAEKENSTANFQSLLENSEEKCNPSKPLAIDPSS